MKIRHPNQSIATITLSILIGLGLILCFFIMKRNPKLSAFENSGKFDLTESVELAAKKHHVPKDILLAIAYTEGRFKLFVDKTRIAWIPLLPWRAQRRVDQNYASEFGMKPKELLQDPILSMQATAKILASLIDSTHADVTQLSSWFDPIAQFHGAHESLSDYYYAEQVLTLVNQGFSGQDEAGRFIEVKGWGQTLTLPFNPPESRPVNLVGEAGVRYYEASLGGFRAPQVQPRKITHIVIHSTENTFPTILDYFRRSNVQVGAHYLIRAYDGFVVQMVNENEVALHDACFSENSLGVEHEGYSANGKLWFTDKMYRASARLVRNMAFRHGIPLSREFILGHGETPDCSEHTDPGPEWDWEKFMNYVQNEKN